MDQVQVVISHLHSLFQILMDQRALQDLPTMLAEYQKMNQIHYRGSGFGK